MKQARKEKDLRNRQLSFEREGGLFGQLIATVLQPWWSSRGQFLDLCQTGMLGQIRREKPLSPILGDIKRFIYSILQDIDYGGHQPIFDRP